MTGHRDRPKDGEVQAFVRHLAKAVDWRFLVALAFLLLVAFVLVGGYASATRKDQQITTKDAQIHSLIEQGRQDRALAAARAARASRERDELLAQTQRLARRLDALLAYLKARGLEDPTSPRTNKNPAAGNALEAPRTSPKEQNARPPGTAAARPQAPGGGGDNPPDPPSPGQPDNTPPTPVRDLLDTLTKGLTP